MSGGSQGGLEIDNTIDVTCINACPVCDGLGSGRKSFQFSLRMCRMSAWSPVRSLQSLAKFFFISGAATATAWYAHPQLLDIAAHVLNLDFKDNVTAFQTSFFSFLSLVFAIYSGNTMAFLYDVSSLLPQPSVHTALPSQFVIARHLISPP